MVRPRVFPHLALVLLLLTGCALRQGSKQRPPFKKLSPSIAYEMMRDNPEMLVLDLRPPQEYNGDTGHIRRAQNIPLDRLPHRLLEISAFREETLLVYCRADDCGEKGVAILIASGFGDAVLMEGGIDGWIKGGFKTVLPGEAASRAHVPADGKGPVRPRRPGELEVAPQRDVPVEPPPDPHSPTPSSPGEVGREGAGEEGRGGEGWLAAPRQIG